MPFKSPVSILENLGLSDVVHGDGVRQIGFSSAQADAPYMFHLASGELIRLATKTQVDGKQPIDNTLTSLSGKDITGLLAYLGIKTAGLRDVGTGTNQIPDMSSQQKGLTGGAGWLKMPNGMIFQWGNTPGVSGGANAAVSFPIAFPNTAAGIVFQPLSDVGPSCALAMHSNLSTSGFTVWGVAKVKASGPSLAALDAGSIFGYLVWGY
ncbi:gp53-like domain-containing protein [Kosakonia sacchari]|uniref:gp53-like domain-containing protein n=1 Tax=Kosakonia sacchari TaxID=1158459 RepID=UPI0015856D6A|nr:hypothetical protein [Kosakonia sacchari]NUL36313.1 hypothetical protein [Kosakonia sacchari]